MITAYTLPPEKLEKAIQLARTGKILWAGDTLLVLVFLVVAWRLGWWVALRARIEGRTSRRWLQGLVFVPVFILATSVLPLPLSMWAHRISLAYGLSVQGWGSWLGDWAKGLVLAIVIGTPLVLGAFAIVRRAPRRAWLWVGLAAIPVQLAGIFIAPYVIDPLFNRFEPLAVGHAALVAKLTSVIDKSGESIPPARMFLMKASDKQTTLNAYVTGFGASKRVVVWDTTADQRPDDEVLFIFGHELGHYALGHIVRGFLIGILGLLLALFLGQRLALWLIATRPHGTRGLDDWAAIGVLAVVFSVLGIVGEPLGNIITRQQERAADVYGQEIIHGLVADPRQTAAHAFQALGEQSLAQPDPNPLWVWWTYSHPSISERVRFAASYDPWPTARYFTR